MKFAPSVGSPLKPAQMHFKTTSFGKGPKKLAIYVWGYKNCSYIYSGEVVWLQLLWQPIYGEPTWLLFTDLYIFSLIDLISRGFDFVWLSRNTNVYITLLIATAIHIFRRGFLEFCWLLIIDYWLLCRNQCDYNAQVLIWLQN